MPGGCQGKTTFFEVFKTRCSESDLGPISLNWFQELTSEAPPYNYETSEDHGNKTEIIELNSFKTPQRKPFTYNQLASTPLIFKEQNVNFSLYSSPLRGPDHCKLDIGKDNAVDKELRKSHCIMKTKLGQANDVTSPPLSACLSESPVVLRGPYRTPQREKPVAFGNLFYTPKLMKVNTPKHISESLGAEVDPDMSWSSSLATPPTLSSTVLIVRDGQTSGAGIPNDTTIMLQKSLSQRGESPKTLDRTTSSVPNVEKTHAEDSVTSQELEKMIDDSFGVGNNFEDHGGKMMKNMSNVMEDEVCDPVIDTPVEDDASFSFPGYKMGSLRKVKLDKTRKKYFKIKTNECEETEKLNEKDKYLSTSETELESCYPSISNITKNEIQKPTENVNEELFKDDVPSSATQWSQLNLSGLDVTQIEKTPLPHTSFCDQNSGERSANSDNECSSLTTFKNVEIPVYKQDEEKITTPQKETILLLKQTSPEISPLNSLSQDRKSSMFKMEQTSKETISMDESSFCTVNTNIATESKVLGNKLENPKSSGNDIACPGEYDSLSANTDGKGNCPTTAKCNSSPLNSTGIISHLKKKTKKFIYVVNDDSTCEGEKIQKTQEIGSKNYSASSHLELNSSETRPEFTNAVSDVLDSSVKRKCLRFNPEKQTVSLTGHDKTMLEECFNESSSPQNDVTPQDIDSKEVKINRGNLESTVTEVGNQSQSQKRGYNNASKSPGFSSIKEQVVAAACLLPRQHTEIELGNIGQNIHFPTKNRTLNDPINSIINTSTQLPQDPPEFPVVVCGEKETLCKMKQKLRFRRNSDSTFLTNKVSSEPTESFTNSHFKKNQETEVLNEISGEAQQVSSEKCKEISSVSLGAQINKNADFFVSLRDQEKKNSITEKTALEPYPEEHLPLNKDNFLLQTIEKNNIQIMDSSEEFFETNFCYLGDSVPENSTEIDCKQTPQELCTEDFYSSEVVPNFTGNLQNKNQAPKLAYECTSLSKNFYSKSTIDTNVKSKKNEDNHLGKWAGNFDPDSNKSLGSGFKTASNKEIILSEYNIKKGKLFFRDIEKHYNSYSSVEIVNMSTSVAAENIKTDLDTENQIKNSFPVWNSESGHPISKDVQSNISVINRKGTDVTLEDLSSKKDLNLSHSLTASQKAEITELSTILEETGSQFEFTQFRKQSPTVQTIEISTNKAADELGNLNTCEVQNTVELDAYFGAKNEINKNRATEQVDLIVNSEVAINVKQKTVGLPKSNSGQVTSTDRFTKNEVDFKGFCSALGRKMSVSNEALQKAMKLFSDIEEIGEETPLQNFRNGSLHRSHKSNIVSTFKIANYNNNNEDFKGKDAKCVHKSQNNVENNTGILVEENILNCSRDLENKMSSCLLSISSHKDNSKLKGSVVPKTSNNCQREINGLSLIGQQNIHLRMPHQLIKQENSQIKEELLDLTYLGEAIKDEEMSTLNISQVESLVSDQKEQKIRENENSYDLQHFQTASGRNIMVSKESFNKVAHLFAEECSEAELNNFSFPLTLKMPNVACNKPMEPSGKEEKNLVESETGEMVLGATRSQLIPVQQGPKIENKKWKEHSMVGFHTASGKKVRISKESLAKVKNFFVEENLENNDTNIKNPETELLKQREEVNEKHEQAYEMVELNNAQVWEEMQSYQDDDEKVLDSATAAGLPKITDSAPCNEPSNSVLFEEELSVNEESKENFILSVTKQSTGLPSEISGLGFYTGHGKSISVSETSLLAARKWMRERDLEDLGGKKANSAVHMEKLVPLNALNNTSSVEDKNCISDKQDSANLSNSMSDVRHNLKHDTKRSDFYHSDKASFFPEHISDKGMSCLKGRPPAFTTASGKAVCVSNEAVQKVREMFTNDRDEFLKPNIETKSENDEMEIVKDFSNTLENKEDISLKSFNGKKKSMSTTDIFVSNENTSTNTGLEMDSELSHCQINSTTSDLYKSAMGTLPKCSSSVGIFCTANGKPVQVSDNSLKKARQVFSEIENNSEQLLSMTSFKDNESRPETLIGEENAMLHAKTSLSEKKNYLSNMLNLHNNSGFSTASGKQVLISENALKKAKGMLAEFELMKSECCVQPLPESTQNVTPKTLSPICIDGGKNPKHTANSKNEETCNKQLNFSNNCDVKVNSSENSTTTKVNCDQFKQDEMQSPLETKLTPAEDSSFLKKEQISFKNVNREGDKILDDLPVKRSLQVSSHSKAPENSLEREAMEIAKAFMEDDELIESELPHNAKQFFFTYKNKEHMQLNSRFGKRRMEKRASYGEPPIKRKLLHEFDRVVESQEKSLKPSKSSPDGTMKDRRMFMHHVPLKPVTCDPFSTTKERQEMRHPNYTAPDQGFTSKSPFLKHQTSENSSYKSLLGSPLYKVSCTDNGKMKPMTVVGKPAKVFVPPFKTKSDSLTVEHVSKRLKLKVKDHTQENEKQKYVDGHNTRDGENNENYLTDKDNSNQATTDVFEEYGDSNLEMIENLQSAREMQQMRIKKKQTQQIHPQAGSLYLKKTSTGPRISLKVAVEGRVPSTYSSKQLYMYGVSKQCLRINSKNAESFKFHSEDYFNKEYLLDGKGIQLADGGWLIPTDEGKLGKEEFYRALCDTPGVDPKLITKTWVYNHYRWIIWKLAAMEFTFPKEFASRCLTPERVLLQLKYRYDIEIDKSRRSALKKIMERDETAAKTLVLCVSEIISSGTNTSIIANSKNSSVDSKKESAVIEVTDGWYAIKALLDTPLLALLHRGKLTVGQKIITHGAELIGSQEACTPLEAPASLMLKLSANSTRPACWYAKLGFFSDPRPFPLPLSSLFGEGGNVGCVDIVIQRVYPTQWVEKTASGSYIFRNERAEEKEALKHAECQQKKLEALLTKIQAEFEKHEESSARQHGLSRILTRHQVRALQDGADLYEAVKNAPDPAYIEGYFSKEQLRALNNYRQMLNDKKQAQLQSEVRKAVAAAELEEPGLSKRDVTMVWKVRVVNYEKQEHSVILSIWRPLSDIYSLLKEGNRYRIYHLATSPSKSQFDRARIRLTATKKTQYQQLPVSHETLFQVYQPRETLPLIKLADPSFQPPCAEVDLVGFVVFITKKPGVAPLVYLSDEYHNLLAVKFWIDLNEDVIKLHTLIAASNLQWRAESRSGIPTLFAGEFSSFSASPKESHFQETFNKLKSSVENIDLFCSDAESKLTHLLNTHNSKQLNAVKEYNLDSPSPQARLGLGHVMSTSQNEPNHHCPEGNSGLTISSVKITPTSDCKGDRKMDDPRICKKRRSLDFFSRLPLPPPISPVCTFVSPAAQKAFQPPRSCGNNYSKPIKKSILNPPQVTTLKTLSGTSVVENDLIADEELALINTQALLSNSPE
ncbi:breast cancer type 2 susceptibility protein [Trichosurus vulpecula]|uniref:breast cancer type 2 susceptibility protein n=1 Tax=Trichosurus vulpecula TaxID=9337 RepID=UPI00186AEB31|nr:breast cancer type 2 susceptibility protein [Trichosurus vulpecula]